MTLQCPTRQTTVTPFGLPGGAAGFVERLSHRARSVWLKYNHRAVTPVERKGILYGENSYQGYLGPSPPSPSPAAAPGSSPPTSHPPETGDQAIAGNRLNITSPSMWSALRSVPPTTHTSDLPSSSMLIMFRIEAALRSASNNNVCRRAHSLIS